MFDGDHSKLGAQQAVDDSVGAAVQHQEDVVEVAYYQGPQRKHLEFNKRECESLWVKSFSTSSSLTENFGAERSFGFTRYRQKIPGLGMTLEELSLIWAQPL